MSVPSSLITDSRFLYDEKVGTAKNCAEKKRPWGKTVNEIIIREGGVDDDLIKFLDANIQIVK